MRIEPTLSGKGAFGFRLPMKPETVNVVSRAASPSELGLARDARQLGIAVRQIRIWKGRHLKVLDAANSELTNGFQNFEPELGIRWTNGSGAIPTNSLPDMDGPFDLEIVLDGQTQYPVDRGC